MSPYEITEELHRKIPISRDMGMEVLSVTREGARLRAPHEANRNHLNTIFGGSLYALGALACYAAFRAIGEEFGFHEDLVIQEGKIEYLFPAPGDFEAEARRPDEASIRRFAEAFQRSGKGRLELSATLWSGSREVAKFTGSYVLMRK